MAKKQLEPEVMADEAPEIVADAIEPIVPDPVRRLHMNRTYRGYRAMENGSEVAILPGTYYEDDPFLYGQAEWFVNEGYAEWIS